MGSYLEAPKTDIETEQLHTDLFDCYTASMQGTLFGSLILKIKKVGGSLWKMLIYVRRLMKMSICLQFLMGMEVNYFFL